MKFDKVKSSPGQRAVRTPSTAFHRQATNESLDDYSNLKEVFWTCTKVWGISIHNLSFVFLQYLFSIFNVYTVIDTVNFPTVQFSEFWDTAWDPEVVRLCHVFHRISPSGQ